MNRINNFILKKKTNVSDFMPVRHRTNIGKFLSKSPWNEEFIDDTISKKTVPSSKDKKPTKKCGFHNSYLKGKTVYGHQLVTVMLLCDSWYSNKKLFIVSKEAVYAYIRELKTNRVIHPLGHERHEIKLNLMSKILTTDDVSLVKVGNNKYYVYTYKDKLNDAKDSLIALYWPKEALFKEGCLRLFITLDTTITT